MNNSIILSNIDRLVSKCIEIDREDILLLYDDSTSDLLNQFVESLNCNGKKVKTVFIPGGLRHGAEPPNDVSDEMLEHETIMCVTKYSLAHTNARRMAEIKGIPFLSMPGFGKDMLENEAFQVDYQGTFEKVKCFADRLTQHNSIRVVSDLGTDVYLDVKGRKGNCCPGFTNSEILLGSPPDIEANIAPVEQHTNGTIVVDGSVTDYRVGLLSAPVMLTIVKGKIESISCLDKANERVVGSIIDDVKNEKAGIIAEFGIGFNGMARLCGNMLVDEGTKGCVHFGIGSNWTIGGANKVDFHLDFVVKNTTVVADGIELIRNGVIIDV